MGKGTVILAYSGGLDTSVCIPLLRERYDFDRVVTVVVNVGQRDDEIATATGKGKVLADAHYTIDAREKFVHGFLFPAIRANGSYEGYPMGTALARPLIAEEVVRVALHEGATTVAHGCTGKGNDQLRFDFIFRIAGLEVVAPDPRTQPYPRMGDRVRTGAPRSRSRSLRTSRGASMRTSGAGASKADALKILPSILRRRSMAGPSLPKKPLIYLI